MTMRALLSIAVVAATVPLAACGSADGSSATGIGSASATTDLSGGARGNCCRSSTGSISEIADEATRNARAGLGIGAIKAVAELPPGLSVGGTTTKTASGYSDSLLAGRWAVREGKSCENIAPRVCGPAGFSISESLGYFGSGLTVTRVRERRFFKSAGCQANDLLLAYRVAQYIAFRSADTLVADESPTANASGRVAVRQGLIGSMRIESSAGNDPVAFGDAFDQVLGPLFAGCPELKPAKPTARPKYGTCAPPTVQLRLEADVAGATLLTDEYEHCQPGLTVPLARYGDSWTEEHRLGLLKQP